MDIFELSLFLCGPDISPGTVDAMVNRTDTIPIFVELRAYLGENKEGINCKDIRAMINPMQEINNA